MFKKQPVVFLSYAREDESQVTDLYDQLTSEGFKVWMDKFSIVGGEDWERSIQHGVKSCDLFIACLSPHSARKRGFVQKEMKLAESVLEGKMPGDIYVIPLMLAPSEIPETIERFQAIRLYENDGYQRLIHAVQEGVRRSNEPRHCAVDNVMLTVVDSELYEPMSDGHSYAVSIRYPQLRGLEGNLLEELNTMLRARAFTFLQDARRSYHQTDEVADGPDFEALETDPSSYVVTYAVTYLSPMLISFMFDISNYGAGAAHGNERTETVSYQLRPLMPVELDDLFLFDWESKPHIEEISTHCIIDLHRQWWAYLAAVEGPAIRAYDHQDILDGAGPDEVNFKAFSFLPDGLMFSFDPYKVGSYAWGTRRVLVPYESLAFIDPNGPVTLIRTDAASDRLSK